MEKLYAQYLLRPDRTLTLNGQTFYRVIHKATVAGRVMITVPRCFQNKAIDERGGQFTLSAPAHIRFIGDIPDWYLQTAVVSVEEISDPDGLGNYLAPISSLTASV